MQYFKRVPFMMCSKEFGLAQERSGLRPCLLEGNLCYTSWEGLCLGWELTTPDLKVGAASSDNHSDDWLCQRPAM